METYTHPSFKRADKLKDPLLRAHFPKSVAEAQAWTPLVRYRALAGKVLVVARTRVECAWAAYIDAVPGMNHDREIEPVLNYGCKLDETLARVLFPAFKEIPYAE